MLRKKVVSNPKNSNSRNPGGSSKPATPPARLSSNGKKSPSPTPKSSSARDSKSQTTSQKPANNKPIVEIHTSPSKSVPKSDMEIETEIKIEFSTHIRSGHNDIQILFSPSFNDIPPKDARTIFTKKCQECSRICDFSKNTRDVNAKSIKTQLLTHIQSAFSIQHVAKSLSIEQAKAFQAMVSANLFRVSPSIHHAMLIDFGESITDAAWVHIKIIYLCLLSCLNIPVMAEFPETFFPCFVQNLLSYDDRERDQSKQFIEQLYSKMVNHRLNIRNIIASFLGQNKCSSELLDIYSQMISTYPNPLKPENISYFVNSILPLYSHPDFSRFEGIFLNILCCFINKSIDLLEIVVGFYFSHWPCSDRNKQIYYLLHIEKLIQSYPSKICDKFFLPHLRKIGNLCNDQCSEIAEMALYLLQDSYLVEFIKHYSNNLYFHFVFTINKCAQTHWNLDIRDAAKDTLEHLEKLNIIQFKKATELMGAMKNKEKTQFTAARNKWTQINEMAKAHKGNSPHFDVKLLDDTLNV